MIVKNLTIGLLLYLISSQKVSGLSDSVDVFVIQQEYHTGISLRTADVNLGAWPECAEFKKHVWVDVGWGDRRFYQSPDYNPLLALKAIAIANPSVMRIEGYTQHPSIYLKGCPTLKIRLSRKQMDRLCTVFHKTYVCSSDGTPKEVNSSYGYKFYNAKGSYHLMNTCNTWVARAFTKAGLDVPVFGIVVAKQLFKALEPYSEKPEAV